MYLQFEKAKHDLERMRYIENGVPEEILGDQVDQAFREAFAGYNKIISDNVKRKIADQEEEVERIRRQLIDSRVIIDRIYVMRFIRHYPIFRISQEVYYSDRHIFRILDEMRKQIKAIKMADCDITF